MSDALVLWILWSLFVPTCTTAAQCAQRVPNDWFAAASFVDLDTCQIAMSEYEFQVQGVSQSKPGSYRFVCSPVKPAEQ
jgi:hypothetical protein